ncbi:MAG TPA: hypothetical protein VFC51_04685 [Chloroflexota bacterium]|nr:hypothetical protein [Chloroflexota bacterium]
MTVQDTPPERRVQRTLAEPPRRWVQVPLDATNDSVLATGQPQRLELLLSTALPLIPHYYTPILTARVADVRPGA